MDHNKLGLDASLIEATKAIVEKNLHPNQEKLDKNKNGKLDKDDFKILRGEKSVKEETEELDEMQHMGSYTHSHVMKKIKSGDWEATSDVKPNKHVELRHHSGKRITVNVQNDPVKEEVEQIDELSKATLGSYVKKATSDMKNADNEREQMDQDEIDTGRKNSAEDQKRRQHLANIGNKREAGIARANKKLTKEQYDEIEALAAKHGLIGE